MRARAGSGNRSHFAGVEKHGQGAQSAGPGAEPAQPRPETRGGSSIPKLSDLRDSGAIEQDADVVMSLRRPSMYKDEKNTEDKDPRLAILDIAKHRNGPTGEVKLDFDGRFTRFSNRQEGVDSGVPE